MNSVSASVGYVSSAALTYGIALTSTSNPVLGDSSGLSIQGTYQQPTDSSSFYAALSGDGQYQTYSPNPATMTVNNGFTGAFSTSGASAVFGTVDTLQTGLFGLTFSNSSPFSYALTVTLNYQLNAAALGVYANTMINLDYWDDDGITTGHDFVGAATFPAQANAQWQFNLASGATENLYTQVGIESHLDSTALAVVPLPSAIWGFLLALFGITVVNRRQVSLEFVRQVC